MNGTDRATRAPIVVTQRPTRVLPTRSALRALPTTPWPPQRPPSRRTAASLLSCWRDSLCSRRCQLSSPRGPLAEKRRVRRVQPPRQFDNSCASSRHDGRHWHECATKSQSARRARGSRRRRAAAAQATPVCHSTLCSARRAPIALRRQRQLHKHAWVHRQRRARRRLQRTPARAALDLASPPTPARAALDRRLSGLRRLLRHGQLRLQRQPWLRARVAAAAATVAGAAEAAAAGGLKRQLRRTAGSCCNANSNWQWAGARAVPQRRHQREAIAVNQLIRRHD